MQRWQVQDIPARFIDRGKEQPPVEARWPEVGRAVIGTAPESQPTWSLRELGKKGDSTITGRCERLTRANPVWHAQLFCDGRDYPDTKRGKHDQVCPLAGLPAIAHRLLD